jgi:protein-L-isoaspartate(D-aspartate) O-methyltransferase
MPLMGSIGKGWVVVLTRSGDEFAARPLSPTAIYSAVSIRDEAMNAEIGKVFMRSPRPAFTRLRRDQHERTEACWIHAPGFCLTA